MRHTLIISLLSASLLAGCALPVVMLGAGGAAGYAVTQDTVSNRFRLATDELFAESLAVAQARGKAKTLKVDQAAQDMRFKVGLASVRIWIEPMGEGVNRLKVKARRFGFPAAGVAQDIFTDITDRLGAHAGA